jgi:hypothetical protein
MMDISKLPRMSKTESPANDAPAPQDPTALADTVSTTSYPAPGAYEPHPPGGLGIEAWLSIGIGLIFLFAFPHFTQWFVHTVFHTKTVPSFLPITDSSSGTEVEIPYSKSIFFMSDLCVSIFSYALIVEGIALVLARRRPWVVVIALVITLVAVGLNLYYLLSSFGDGLPVVSAIAVVFGGYMLWYQSKVFADVRQRRAAARRTAV